MNTPRLELRGRIRKISTRILACDCQRGGYIATLIPMGYSIPEVKKQSQRKQFTWTRHVVPEIAHKWTGAVQWLDLDSPWCGPCPRAGPGSGAAAILFAYPDPRRTDIPHRLHLRCRAAKA